MERVTGIGGVFFRSRDPEALVAWYAEHVGVPVQPDGYVVFAGERGAHVWAPFRADTDYWPAEKHAMVNFTVGDLDAMLSQLRDAGVEVDEQGRGPRRDRALRLGGRPRGQPLRALATDVRRLDDAARPRSGRLQGS